MQVRGAPGLRPRWIVEGELAVSPMPSPADLEGLQRFPSVYSLATPSEYALGGGLDPRAESAAVENFVWRPTGEYNAPSLPALARDMKRLKEPRPVLVHCFRGCGRSSMAAAAWLMRYKSSSVSEAVSTVSGRGGCGLETLPQLSVLQAYSVALAAGLEDWVAGSDTGDPFPEYLLLLSYKLSWLLPGEPCPRDTAVRARSDEGHPFNRLARLLSRQLGYSLAGVEARGGKPTGVRVVLTVWIPRGAHPAAVPRPVRPPRGLEERVASILAEAGEGGLGKVEVEVSVRMPGEPPWL